MNKFIKLSLVALVSIVAISGIALGAAKLASALGDSGKTATKCGPGSHRQYNLVIKNNKFAPSHLDAKLCDKMTVTNKDDRNRLIAFGTHDEHQAYDGISERYLLRGESFTVTLNKKGDFLVHDHHEDEVKATFIIR